MTNTDKTDLLPCPFCGSTNVAQGASRDMISVWCFCGAQGPSVPFPEINPEPIVAIHKCFEAWNRRAFRTQSPAEWQEISTAPTDGTPVWAISMDAQSPAPRVSWFDPDGRWVRVRTAEKFVASGPVRWWPTHWKPIRAASITPPAPERSKEEVGVKPLEWIEYPNTHFPDVFGHFWDAETPFIRYTIEEVSGPDFESETPHYEVNRGRYCLICTKLTLLEAKAAAQDDYEQRILSALEPASLHKGESVAADRAMRGGEPCGWPDCGCDFDAKCSDAPAPLPVTITPEQAVLDALQPFHDAVFNDNGDITVNGPYDYEFAVAAYFAHRKLTAALGKPGEQG